MHVAAYGLRTMRLTSKQGEESLALAVDYIDLVQRDGVLHLLPRL